MNHATNQKIKIDEDIKSRIADFYKNYLNSVIHKMSQFVQKHANYMSKINTRGETVVP